MRRDRHNSYLPWVVMALWLQCHVAGVSAQDGRWETATSAGVQAFGQRRYSEAAQQFEAALAMAKVFKPEDPRLVTSLMNLASVYHIQGQYIQAEPLYQRALELQEQRLGPEHLQLVDVLQAYAALQRRMHPMRSLLPWSTANKLLARARRLQEYAEPSKVPILQDPWADDETALFSDGGS